MASSARLTAYAARKATLSREICHGLHEPDLDADRLHDYILALTALDKDLESLRAEFEALWLARARYSEIYVILGHYARLRGRYYAAIQWLKKQQQALASGESIDAELNTYDAGDYSVLWQAGMDW
jgi:hypothetical protein